MDNSHALWITSTDASTSPASADQQCQHPTYPHPPFNQLQGGFSGWMFANLQGNLSGQRGSHPQTEWLLQALMCGLRNMQDPYLARDPGDVDPVPRQVLGLPSAGCPSAHLTTNCGHTNTNGRTQMKTQQELTALGLDTRVRQLTAPCRQNFQ